MGQVSSEPTSAASCGSSSTVASSGVNASPMASIGVRSSNTASSSVKAFRVSSLQVKYLKQKFTTNHDVCVVRPESPPDFCIAVGEEEFHVHRDILAARSHYFHCLFECGMQETQTGRMEIKESTVEVVRTMIAYVYGELILIDQADVTDYLDIVEMWQLVELKDELELFISNLIDTDNCMEWYHAALRYVMEKVLIACTQVIILGFQNDPTTASQEHLASLELPHIMELLRSGVRRNPVRLDVALRVCINWVLADEANRKELFEELLRHIGLTSCSPGFMDVATKVSLNSKHMQRAEVEPYAEMMLWRTFTQHNTPGPAHSIILLGNMHNFGEGASKLLQFNFDDILSIEGMREIRSLPLVHYSHLVTCWTPDGLFSCRQQGGTLECALFDIPSGKYVALPAITLRAGYEHHERPIDAVHERSVFANGKVYILCSRSVNMCCLDLKNVSAGWLMLQPYKFLENNVQVCSIMNTIYIFNCNSDCSTISNFRSFDTLKQSWGHPAHPPRSLTLFSTLSTGCISVVPSGLYIYVLKWCSDGVCARYSCLADQWSRLTPPVSRTFQPSCSVVCVGERYMVTYCNTNGPQTHGTVSVWDMGHDGDGQWMVKSFPVPWSLRSSRAIAL